MYFTVKYYDRFHINIEVPHVLANKASTGNQVLSKELSSWVVRLARALGSAVCANAAKQAIYMRFNQTPKMSKRGIR